ncbi:hypothetical protein BKA57DRAFT_468042 [Linnemannia elongata]|nr:hypothetical protein BKA57DRAFT_468042 [Linnemannia elongata]
MAISSSFHCCLRLAVLLHLRTLYHNATQLFWYETPIILSVPLLFPWLLVTHGSTTQAALPGTVPFRPQIEST